ncbi:hypothetical protein CASFOL_020128 [Castilleja foliolosa]|uniref:Uncharacterized protein n=1 Tax=Castilleja foliolosa TaxID=1961234 RepID=A0ABD3D1Z1_9LAMI
MAAVEERARAAREADGDDAIDIDRDILSSRARCETAPFGTGSKGADFVNSNSTARPAPVDEEMVRRRVRQEVHCTNGSAGCSSPGAVRCSEARDGAAAADNAEADCREM